MAFLVFLPAFYSLLHRIFLFSLFSRFSINVRGNLWEDSAEATLERAVEDCDEDPWKASRSTAHDR